MIELIVSGVAVVVSLTSVMIARHYFKETKEIERRFQQRRKEQSVTQKSQQGKGSGDYPRYSS